MLTYESTAASIFKPPRPLDEIDAELKTVADRIMTMLKGLAE